MDNPQAARQLVGRVFGHVEHLQANPKLGTRPRELSGGQYRQIIEPPCRIFYRVEADAVLIVHVMRSEQRLRRTRLPRPE